MNVPITPRIRRSPPPRIQPYGTPASVATSPMFLNRKKFQIGAKNSLQNGRRHSPDALLRRFQF
jgi:hypothetical protein